MFKCHKHKLSADAFRINRYIASGIESLALTHQSLLSRELLILFSFSLEHNCIILHNQNWAHTQKMQLAHPSCMLI